MAFCMAFLLPGCFHHQIAFEDVHYLIVPAKQYDKKVVAVIDPQTLEKQVSIHSAAAGLAHYWDAQPGRMLKQVADVELPQIFLEYQFYPAFDTGNVPDKTIVLEMFIDKYKFADFHTSATVRIVAYGLGKKFDNVYIGEGFDQGGKVSWTGAFGMKSAIRQSSLDAYQKIFKALREDLRREFEPEKIE
jgi:hypothetical protein